MAKNVFVEDFGLIGGFVTTVLVAVHAINTRDDTDPVSSLKESE